MSPGNDGFMPNLAAEPYPQDLGENHKVIKGYRRFYI